MSDSIPHAPINEALVKASLVSLGKRLRLNLFVVKGIERKQRTLARQEAAAKAEVRRLKLRVQRELDTHPDIVRRLSQLGEL